MEEDVELALVSDRGAFCGLLVAACTAASAAAPRARLVFHILDGGIPDDDFSFFQTCLTNCNLNVRVNRIPVTVDAFSGFRPYNGNRMVYARLLLAKLLPDVNRVIYFDTDFYWRADVARLWQETEGVDVIAAALDQNEGGVAAEHRWFDENGIEFPKNGYFCAGLCVINLARWRELGVYDRLIDFLRQHPNPPLCEQTAMNAVIRSGVCYLPLHWQRSVRKMTPDEFKSPVALHFTAEAPWRASHSTNMLTDAQLLWFKTDAELREQSLWRSLRRYYSPMKIVRCRVLYILIMKIPPCRWVFHLFLAKTGRCFFDERV